MNILGIGVATLDIVNLVDEYPTEDSEIRAVRLQRRRGGNATNTLVVLSQMGHRCSWGGVLAGDPDAQYLISDLERYGIDYRYCPIEKSGRTPTSCIILGRRSGSRTIIHYRDLSEFGSRDFKAIDLTPFDWIHFEGRNVAETRRMLLECSARRPSMPRSLEVEKERAGIETLFPLADLLLFSKVYANHHGFDDPLPFLRSIRKQLPNSQLVCAWGAAGAVAMDSDGSIVSSPAYPPARVIDTTGAGDVFNAAIIDGLIRGETIGESVTAACRLAGKKCGVTGIDGLFANPSHSSQNR